MDEMRRQMEVVWFHVIPGTTVKVKHSPYSKFFMLGTWWISRCYRWQARASTALKTKACSMSVMVHMWISAFIWKYLTPLHCVDNYIWLFLSFFLSGVVCLAHLSLVFFLQTCKSDSDLQFFVTSESALCLWLFLCSGYSVSLWCRGFDWKEGGI